MNAAQEQADIQRAEAKRLLNSAFGWDENITSEAVNKAVDCIIGAAIKEMLKHSRDANRIMLARFELEHRPFVSVLEGLLRLIPVDRIKDAESQEVVDEAKRMIGLMKARQ